METSDPVLEGLIRDIMIVASECEFDNDIHLLVDSLTYQDPASTSLDDLMAINDHYGDIVYNLISLREMYNQPIHELIDGPAFPLFLVMYFGKANVLVEGALERYEDCDPDEIKAAMALVSHAQKEDSANNMSGFYPEPTTAQPQDTEGFYNSTQQPSSSPVQPPPSLLHSMSLLKDHHGGVASSTHCWATPTDNAIKRKRKKRITVSSNSSSSSSDLYVPKKWSRQLFQMEPTVLAMDKVMDGGGGTLIFPESYPSEGACCYPHPQASLGKVPLLPSTIGPVLPTPSTPKRVTSNSSNDDDERGLDFHTFHLMAARERRASRRQRRLITPRGTEKGACHDEALRRQSSCLGDAEQLPLALGVVENKSWEQIDELISWVGNPSNVGPVLPPSVSTGQVQSRIMLESGSMMNVGVASTEMYAGGVASTEMNAGCVVSTAMVITLHAHTHPPATSEPNRSSISNVPAPPPPPPPPPLQPVPAPSSSVLVAAHSSSVGSSSDRVLQLEKKDFGFKRAKPRKQSEHKHKDDKINEYQGLKLWQFLLHLLLEGKHPSILRWVSRGDGLFRVLDSEGLAQMWGGRRGHTDMNYDKLSRALRYYYNKNLLDKAPRRLHYQFKYYSRWWEGLEAVDPTFKMESVPLSPKTKLPKEDIIAMGIVQCEEQQDAEQFGAEIT